MSEYGNDDLNNVNYQKKPNLKEKNVSSNDFTEEEWEPFNKEFDDPNFEDGWEPTMKPNEIHVNSEDQWEPVDHNMDRIRDQDIKSGKEKNFERMRENDDLDQIYINDKTVLNENEIQRIKDYIINIDWYSITKDWTIKYQKNQYSDYEIIQIDPKQDCSKTNPLYKHKKWLERIYNDKKLKLSDRLLARICGVSSHNTIRKWREKHNIPARKGTGRWIGNDGYIRIYMPEGYNHPEIKSIPGGKGRYTRFEHVIVMEKYLSKHPELEISKKCLIEGKYIKKGCVVHHVNYIHNDNRLENLWLFENQSGHKKAEQTLYECFRDLIKLKHILFKNGKYYLNEHLELTSSEIKEILKPIPVNYYEDIIRVKEAIKKINWDSISDDWTAKYRVNRNSPFKTISLDPYSDCSKKNPLYRHKAWFERLVNDKRFNLTDPRLGKLCGIPITKILYWRRVHNIKGKRDYGFKRFEKAGRIWIKVPKGYRNPIAKKNKGYMLECRYIFERYLAEHPELIRFRKYLIDGKYLKPECAIHHINFDPSDNRFENLWVCENGTEHKLIEGSIWSLIDELLKSKLIVFRDGEYYLNYL